MPGPASGGDEPGKRACRRVPWTKPTKPAWTDDKREARDLIKESREVGRAAQIAPPKSRRPPYKPAVVVCASCKAREEVHPQLAPGREAPYVCDRCRARMAFQ